MIRGSLHTLVAAAIGLAPPPSALAQNDPAERRCAELASSPDDPGRVGAGVRRERIDIAAALAACAQAVERDAGHARNHFHYARALHAAQHTAEAALHYQKAGDAGFPDAYQSLAALFVSESPPRYEQALAWTRRAVQGGSALGTAALGWHYHEGKGVPADFNEAFRLFGQAAQRGDAHGMYFLGLAHLRGDGTPQNDAQALRWIRAAAERGHAGAQNTLGDFYLRGRIVPRSEEEALRWHRQAADAGNASAQFWVGAAYDGGRVVPKDDATAVAWYRKAAAQQDPDAMTQLGYHLRDGRGVVRNEREAMEWFGKAATKRHPDAQFALGWGFLQGQGVPRDAWQAGQWFEHAAAQGSAAAQLQLGLLYRQGLGVKPDPERARTLFIQAARSPYPEIANQAKALASAPAAPPRQSTSSTGDHDALLGAVVIGLGVWALWELFGSPSAPRSSGGQQRLPSEGMDNSESQRILKDHIQQQRSDWETAAAQRQQSRDTYYHVQRCGFNANVNCF